MDHEPRAAEPIDLAALYTTYGPAVYRFFLQRTGHAQDAEDLTAATFSKALASQHRYQEQGRQAAWLFSIARHTLLDERRRRRARPAHTAIEPALADTQPLPEAQVLLAEQAQLLYDLLGQLPVDQREALLLRFFGEIEIGEIAGRMGRSAGAIKMLIQRALARLRERYRLAERATASLLKSCAVVLILAPAPRYAYALQPATRHRDAETRDER